MQMTSRMAILKTLAHKEKLLLQQNQHMFRTLQKCKRLCLKMSINYSRLQHGSVLLCRQVQCPCTSMAFPPPTATQQSNHECHNNTGGMHVNTKETEAAQHLGMQPFAYPEFRNFANSCNSTVSTNSTSTSIANSNCLYFLI